MVACEESQAVTMELRRLGHEAYSCDTEPSSGEHVEWHIQQDVLPLLNGKCYFKTSDGVLHDTVDRWQWDMIIAFPPCTHLCSAGQHWFTRGFKDTKLRDDAISFFMAIANTACEKIAIENPIGIMSTRWRKPDQRIQPWQFGHPYTKTTCLWLKNLPHIMPTKILKKPETGWENQAFTKSGKYGGFINRDSEGKILAWNDPRTAKLRSRTFPGVAKAMAEQWVGAIQQN